ncbi:hypothetical protein Tco_0038171 [Tanacetum coccineum]
MPTIEEGEVIEEFRTRDEDLDTRIDDYPSYCDDKKIHIDCALMNVPFFVGTFSIMTDFAILKDMDAYHDNEMGDVIFGEPFLREVGIKTKWFEGIITLYNGDNEVTYQMVRSHPKFKHHTNEQCNKIPPLLKDEWEVDRYGNANLVIMEYLVNISKRRAFWSLNEDILKINDSNNQYAVSIKEDTAYPCLHSPKDHKGNKLNTPYQEKLNTPVHGDDVAKTVFRMCNGHVEVYGYAFWVNQCTSGFHGVNEPGGVRVAREDDRGVTEGREDVSEVFQQRGSGAKRKLSGYGRNQIDILKITILKTNTPYPSRRYGVSVPALTKDHRRLKINTSYPEDSIRRIQDMESI